MNLVIMAFGMKVLLTTSREPSRRTRSFLNDLVASVPHSIRYTRGKATLDDLYLMAKRKEAYGVVIVFQKKANPSALTYYRVGAEGLIKEYLLKLSGVSLLREIRGSQKPLNLKKLVISIDKVLEGFPQEVAEALIEIFRPKVTVGKDKEQLEDAVELVVGGEKELLVSFLCTSTGRVCGPQFRVSKVIKYGSKTR